MGGSITAHNAAEGGARFEVRLRAHAEREAPAPARA
jgi:C4-dicarboxylate-specific signal transduction histidine kinase